MRKLIYSTVFVWGMFDSFQYLLFFYFNQEDTHNRLHNFFAWLIALYLSTISVGQYSPIDVYYEITMTIQIN